MGNTLLQSTVVKVHCTNKDTGLCIITIKGADSESKKIIKSEKNGQETITLLGTYFNPKIGENLSCQGYFKKHDKFGKQFSAKEILSSDSLNKIYTSEIIQTDIIRQIKEERRKEVYKVYGDKGFELIMSNPELLVSKNIITKEEMESVKKDASKLKMLAKSYSYLREMGLPQKQAYNVLEARGNISKAYVTTDPYSLLDVPGIGFKSLDLVANKIGMAFDSEARLDHCFNYVLVNHSEQGHTSFPLEKLASVASKDISVGPKEVKNYLRNKVQKGQLLYTENGMIFSTYQVHESEKEISNHLFRIASTPSKNSVSAPDFSNESGYLKDGQKSAIANAIANKISVITGGPGVGKTTVVKHIMEHIKEQEGSSHKIVLAAPTGKAARRMTESSGLKAETIHTLLDYNPEIGFKKSEFDALKGDTIIIDELSMVDLGLFHALLRAVPSSSRLILVGDADQLSSVGPGSVLKDIINSNRVPVSYLKETVRRDGESLISTNSYRVNSGNMPIFSNDLSSDFIWVDANSDEEIKKKIKALASIIPAKFNIPISNTQVLCPQKETLCGVNSLNRELNEVMNPVGKGTSFKIRSFGRDFRINDRVMQVRNNKKLNINNGDVGTIKSFDMKNQLVKIKFEEFTRDLPIKNLGHMSAASAITIHKSQGSEYDAVIMPISKSNIRMLSRETVYTGMTRAKKLLIMIGDKEAMSIAVRNENKQSRVTGLTQAIINKYEENSMKNTINYNADQEPSRPF